MKTASFTLLVILSSFCSVKAQNNNSLMKPERIYLKTDRNIYIAGEYLFYTLYLNGNPGRMSKYAYLILRNSHNSLIIHDRLEIVEQKAFGSIYLPDTLGSAIYQIVCYTNSMRNEAGEDYFYKEILIANRFDEKLDVITEPSSTVMPATTFHNKPVNKTGDENLVIDIEKKIFNQREKISFAIESSNIPQNDVAYLSVSISEIIPLIQRSPSISEYFGFSDYVTDSGESDQDNCRYCPEINGPVLQGRVSPATRYDNQDDSVTGSNITKYFTVLLSTPDSIVNMQYTQTDSLGSFSFQLNRFYDGKELFIRLKEKQDANISIDNKFNLIKPFTPSDAFNAPGIKTWLNRSRNIVQVQKLYDEHEAITVRKEFPPAKTIPRVYYKKYAVIFPSDFLVLNDFVEISREIVPYLKLRRNHNKYVAAYPNLLGQAQMDDEPALFLDGVPIDDINQIISFGSSQIIRIESLPVIRFYGEMSMTGILSVFSKDMLINTIQFQTPTIRYQMLSSQYYTKPEPFKPVDNSEHIPDLRQLLLWEPEIILKKDEKKQIECYASDLTGKYRIDIEGITSGGETVSGSATITIQSDSE
jgi:hypothetical protein